jgi:hypothetical protein
MRGITAIVMFHTGQSLKHLWKQRTTNHYNTKQQQQLQMAGVDMKSSMLEVIAWLGE